MVEKVNPVYKVLKKETPIDITLELQETLDPKNKVFRDFTDLHWNSFFQ